MWYYFFEKWSAFTRDSQFSHLGTETARLSVLSQNWTRYQNLGLKFKSFQVLQPESKFSEGRTFPLLQPLFILKELFLSQKEPFSREKYLESELKYGDIF